MVKVLLRSNWFVAGHFFAKASKRGPVDIPEEILAEHKLPPLAKVVGKDYVPPKPPVDDRKTLAEAQAEAMAKLSSQADAGWDARQRRRRHEPEPASDETEPEPASDETEPEPASDETEPANSILAGSVKSITPKLEGMSETALRKLLDDERAGKGRPSLLVEIEAAIEDLGAH